MIIDCHCHAGKGDLLTGPWDTDAPLEKYLLRADEAGIQKTVIFSPFHSNYPTANRNTHRISVRHPGRFFCFATLHTERDRGRIFSMIEHVVVQWGFCGIKVHRLDAPLTREVCEAAKHWRIPILYDPVGQTDLIELLAPQYPTVNFIIPHLGSFSDDWRAHRRIIDQLCRYSNVYGDTSGIRRFDYLEEAVQRAGPGKILFGSDGPALHPGLELHKIELLKLTRSEKALILGQNLLKLLPVHRVTQALR